MKFTHRYNNSSNILFLSLNRSNGVTVALFSADWAEQCKQILDVMDELSKKPDLKEISFINVPAEELSEISLKHQVRVIVNLIIHLHEWSGRGKLIKNNKRHFLQVDAVPTVIFFRNSTAIDRIDGIDIAKLTETCKNLANSPTNNSKGSLEDRLKSLINKSKVMIFMKGDRVTPRCGFSKQLIAIVNDVG